MQQLDSQTTIVAVSSPIVAAHRAIIRLSGHQTRDILEVLIRAVTAEQQAAKARLLNAPAAWCETLPCDLGLGGRTLPVRVYYWPDERSYTGQPCAELHVLGAMPIVESLMQRIASAGGVPATRGEFTLRSFLAGKLDLTQAEAVLGVIESDSEQQLEQALQQLGGNISSPIRTLRDQLLELIAHLEAGLDFVEEDIEFISTNDLLTSLEDIAEQLRAISTQIASRGTRQRRPRLVLVGLPNAGKSSLFNSLLGQPRAIVSSEAGTTRDAVSATLELDTQSVEMIDTAGMEQLSAATPRGLAQQVLEDRLASADAILLCIDLAQPCDPSWVHRELERLRLYTSALLVVGTKLDLASPPAAVGSKENNHRLANLSSYLPMDSGVVGLAASIHDPASLQRVREALQRLLAEDSAPHHSDALHRTTVRCSRSLELAIAAIERAAETARLGAGEELVAAELRIALDDLAAVIGEVHTEDILGQIFSRFCIGK